MRRGLRWASSSFLLGLVAWLMMPSAAAAKAHVIGKGEVLGGIAKRYGCTVEAIQKKNRLDGVSIRAGDSLEIPSSCSRQPAGKGRKKKKTRIHTVKKGQNLGRIARKYKCTIKQLKRANGLRKTLLHIGDRLRVPDCSRAVKKGKRPRKRKPKLTSGFHKTDHKTLKRVMREYGFKAPRRFKAVVYEMSLNAAQSRVIGQRKYAYGQTGDDVNWNPASTIKLYSAITALERVKAKGFRSNARATFYDFNGKKKSYRVGELVTRSLVKSDNLAHNRLVQLAGHDWLNTRLKRNGLKHSGIHRPYEKSRWIPMTGAKTLRDSPKVVLRAGKRKRTLPVRKGKKKFPCMGSAACASLDDLAETMRRLMLHEQLPASQRFRLGAAELKLIRRALAANRKRGMEVVRPMEKQLRNIVMFHKPGFSEDWMSDVVYVYTKNSRKRWVVVMAGWPGRSTVSGAASVIAKIIADGGLDRLR